MPRVGSDVVFGAGAVVVGPIFVEDNSLIPANSVVTRDWPSASFPNGVDR
jgi:serine acetyltransferase